MVQYNIYGQEITPLPPMGSTLGAIQDALPQPQATAVQANNAVNVEPWWADTESIPFHERAWVQNTKFAIGTLLVGAAGVELVTNAGLPGLSVADSVIGDRGLREYFQYNLAWLLRKSGVTGMSIWDALRTMPWMSQYKSVE